ncbi:MAG: hypothetical protein DRI79_07560, partial [Chloroflexi bacterium]
MQTKEQLLKRYFTKVLSLFVLITILGGALPIHTPPVAAAGPTAKPFTPSPSPTPVHLPLTPSTPKDFPGPGIQRWYYLAGDLVNVANGNLFFTQRDLLFPARGFDIEITRAYNSLLHDVDSPFGLGWTFNYNLHLTIGDDTVTVHDANGAIHTYVYSPTLDAYVPPPGIHRRLTADGDGYTLWTKDGTRSSFDENGRLLAVTDANGNRLTFTYTADRLTRIADDSGLTLDFYYDGGHITRVEDPAGRQIRYDYDEAGHLIRVTDALSHSISFDYNPDHSLARYDDRLGQSLFFFYDTGGRVTDIWYAKKGERSHLSPFRLFHFRYLNGETAVTNARGFTYRVTYGPYGEITSLTDPLGNTAYQTWNADLRRTALTDFNGHTTTYAYDAYGNRTRKTDPLGHSTVYVWENFDTPERYQALLRSETDPLGATTTYEYDAAGNLITTTNP